MNIDISEATGKFLTKTEKLGKMKPEISAVCIIFTNLKDKNLVFSKGLISNITG